MAVAASGTRYIELAQSIMPELEELADQIERTDSIPDRVFQVLEENDFLRLTLPEEWGGKGLSLAEYFPVLEEIAQVHGTIRMLVHGANGMWRPVFNFGTQEQKARYLPIFQRGGLFTFALTEPVAGSGRDIRTTAERDGDEWVLNGTKHLISFATIAELILVMAATGRGPKGAEVSCFLFPKGTPGVHMTPLPPTMGCRGSEHDVMVFKDCRLPADSVLGKVGEGIEVGVRGFLDVSRLSIAVSCLAPAQRSLALAARFAKQRQTFGKPIADRQAVQTMLAEMAADIYAVRAAVKDCAARFDRDEVITPEAAMCKLLGLEMAGRVTDRALRIHGGIGYTAAHKVERHYRDVRALWFEEGTAEIQKLVVARDVLDKY
jgi:alkylation response protein AidB-like acyl-CoA dehydrogenase